MNATKIIKVVMTFEDGSTLTMQGKQAQKWQSHLNSMVLFASSNGHNLFDSDPVVMKFAFT